MERREYLMNINWLYSELIIFILVEIKLKFGPANILKFNSNS